MTYSHTLSGRTFEFRTLTEVLAKASPHRSGDVLSGAAAESAQERAAARWVLSDITLKEIFENPPFPYEVDSVTRVINDDLDLTAFESIAAMTVGEFREWLLTTAYEDDAALKLARVSRGLTPEMVAAVSKLMGNGELIAVAQAVENIAQFRTTVGAQGTLATRLQPNHPTDDAAGVAASIADGLLMGSGDAVIGINPATDIPSRVDTLLKLIDDVRINYEVPAQSCVLTHVTTTIDLMEQGSPVDLVFQSIAGTEGANKSFGVTPEILDDAYHAALELDRGTIGKNCMYFETGQGSALSAGAHLDPKGNPVDQQTIEARAYGLARRYNPLLVNTVVGFIGPEYLYDGKQIIRAGLEDLFCGKLLGLTMGVDVCYTNHAEADSDDMDTLLQLLMNGGAGFVICVPGSDDIMLGYQSLSYHDVALARKVSGMSHAPEFEEWLTNRGLINDNKSLSATPSLGFDDLLQIGRASS